MHKKSNTKKDSFILVMPSYNEASRIKKALLSWIPIVKKVTGSQILIIDGSSTDNTAMVVKELAKKYKSINLVVKKRQGYGKDLIYGYKKAVSTHHKWIFQTDTDAPFKTTDFYKLWEKRHTSPLILGKRYKRNDPTYRLLIAFLVQVWIVILFRIILQDSNIPFRLIRKNFLKNMIGKIPETTIAPNIFLSILAAKAGHNLHHIPVKHFFRNNSQNTKRILKGALRGIFEIITFVKKIS